MQRNLQAIPFERRFIVRVSGKFPQSLTQSISYNDMHFKLMHYDSYTDTSLLRVSIRHNYVKQAETIYKVTDIRMALKEVKFPVLNDLANGGRFVGNTWLESRPCNRLPIDLKKKYHQ